MPSKRLVFGTFFAITCALTVATMVKWALGGFDVTLHGKPAVAQESVLEKPAADTPREIPTT